MEIIEVIKDVVSKIWKEKDWIFSGIGNSMMSLLGKSIRKSVSGLISETKKKGILHSNDDLVNVLEINKTISDYFPEYNDFLLIQYGSSADPNEANPNDYDFIVLLLGHPKEDTKSVHNNGTYPSEEIKNIEEDVDIVFRDYLSFLFAACAGMPYENSVITKSKLLVGHEGYYMWLKNITMNIMIDSEFLLRRFEDKIIAERQAYINAKNKEIYEEKDIFYKEYDVIRAGYYYVTSLLQREEIKKFKKVIMQDEVAKLSKVIQLGEGYFTDNEVKNNYVKLVNLLKRNDKNIMDFDVKFIDQIIDIIIKGEDNCEKKEYESK
ncbi:hypothetical protein SR42_00445 [Clostridium botulinum]|uniref:hypothetical protein n=1 Tax=Clostridium botulinum TaxID=1491 RepID=UPI000597E882|nr:hypothetical protein [Clostridium botulinum]KIL07556.1 hypothetical protein SR42_00445 [Clostridium botulinum]MBY6935439.1 hypothetical protein [Clostridium botulinum]NFL82182.1 hypothetical protein [Clostridium botulinum]NFN12604.1 hypothetical protein [Clostridium botulinum]NFO37770.1 hypothetical protein [Clostridium botulinum]